MSQVLLLEFETTEALLRAIPQLRRDGLEPLEAYTPFSVEGLAEALGHPPSRVRPVMLAAALLGAAAAFGLQAWSAVVDYPIDVGGRPLFSWPAFVPVTFEVMVLSAAVCGFVALLAACGLPRLHHPLFDGLGFDRASHDRFFLEVRLEERAMGGAELAERLRRLGAKTVQEVPR